MQDNARKQRMVKLFLYFIDISFTHNLAAILSVQTDIECFCMEVGRLLTFCLFVSL